MEDKNLEITNEHLEDEPQKSEPASDIEQLETSSEESVAENGQTTEAEQPIETNDEPTYKPTSQVENVQSAILYTPVTAPKEPRKTNKGFKVFLALVAVVMSVCICLTVGYLAGRSHLTPTKKDAPVGVVSKPKGETLTSAEIYEAVSKSVVAIVVYDGSGAKGSASGVAFKDGYILTNDHIYADVPNAKFIIVDIDGNEYDAYYVAGDARTDIAVLRTEAKLPIATFCNSKELVVGEDAIAIGYPAGAYEKPIFTKGSISSTSRRKTSKTSYSTQMIQTDSAINPGSSGGALVNAWGQVIGITSSKDAGSYYDSVGYAIPSNSAIDIANKLIEFGYVKGRAVLGISYTENTAVNEKLNPDDKAGLVIGAITEGGPMEQAGVVVGEIITEVNGVRTKKADVVLDTVESLSAGESITITVYNPKTKQSRKITATLGEDKGSSSYQITGNSDTTEIK